MIIQTFHLALAAFLAGLAAFLATFFGAAAFLTAFGFGAAFLAAGFLTFFGAFLAAAIFKKNID